MNILILYDRSGIGGGAALPSRLSANISLRQIDEEGVRTLIDTADFIAVAGGHEGEDGNWKAVKSLLAARDMPVGAIKLIPPALLDLQHLSGGCKLAVSKGGGVELQCLAQQLVSEHMRLAATVAAHLNEDEAGPRISRFTFQGD